MFYKHRTVFYNVRKNSQHTLKEGVFRYLHEIIVLQRREFGLQKEGLILLGIFLSQMTVNRLFVIIQPRPRFLTSSSGALKRLLGVHDT